MIVFLFTARAGGRKSFQQGDRKQAARPRADSQGPGLQPAQQIRCATPRRRDPALLPAAWVRVPERRTHGWHSLLRWQRRDCL